MTGTENQSAAEGLAKRPLHLNEVVAAESGSGLTYSQIADDIKQRGADLFRSRWTRIINDCHYAHESAVFKGTVAVFDVDDAFLIDIRGATTPEKVATRFNLVRFLWAVGMDFYSSRLLARVLPKTRHAIQTDSLDETDSCAICEHACALKVGPSFGFETR